MEACRRNSSSVGYVHFPVSDLEVLSSGLPCFREHITCRHPAESEVRCYVIRSPQFQGNFTKVNNLSW